MKLLILTTLQLLVLNVYCQVIKLEEWRNDWDAWRIDSNIYSLKESNYLVKDSGMSEPQLIRSYHRDIYVIFNRSGNMVTEYNGLEGNKVEYKFISTHSYDSEGREVEWKRFYHDEPDAHWTYSYDVSDSIVKRNCLLEGELTYIDVYKYNEDGAVIEQYSVNENGEVTGGKTVFDHFPGGRKLKVTNYNAEGVIDLTSTFWYDEYGYAVKIVSENAKGTITSTQVYEHDEHGNWVKCSNYLNGVLDSVRKRELTYFKNDE